MVAASARSGSELEHSVELRSYSEALSIGTTRHALQQQLRREKIDVVHRMEHVLSGVPAPNPTDADSRSRDGHGASKTETCNKHVHVTCPVVLRKRTPTALFAAAPAAPAPAPAPAASPEAPEAPEARAGAGAGTGDHAPGDIVRVRAFVGMEAASSVVGDEPIEASRRVPEVIHAAVQRLLDEYGRLEQLRQQASYNETRLHARIAELEKKLHTDEQARIILAKRVSMLEYALREKRSNEPKSHLPLPNAVAKAKNNVHFALKASPSAPGPLLQPKAVAPGSTDLLEPQKNSFNSAENKYKTLPSNFLASSRSSKAMSPGRRMLWKYLEELGYMPNPKESDTKVPSAPMASVTVPSQQQSQPALPQPKLVGSYSMSPTSLKAISLSVSTSGPDIAKTVPLAITEAISPPAEKPPQSGLPTVDENVEPPNPAKPTGSNTTDTVRSFKWSASSADEPLDSDLIWKPKLTLLHHLDSIRTVCFQHQHMSLLTGSEDGTVKLWGIAADRGPKLAQPVHTFRGHFDIVTSLTVLPNDSMFASASIDGRIILWDMPDINDDPYLAQGCPSKYLRSVLTGHTDAVWDVHVPSAEFPGILFSAGADAKVNAWKLSAKSDSDTILRSFEHGNGDIPSSVRTLSTDTSKLLAAYISGDVVEFDVETGKALRVFEISDKARTTCIRSHPQHALAFVGGTDHSISFLDVNSGSCVHRMLAHAHAVTSISVSPDGSAMMSSCHDSSIRFWDITKRICVQDLSAHQTHRRKYSEGIHCVSYHPTLPCVASGGADCAVKVYQG